MPVFNGYHYEPLCPRDEIRLLALESAERRDASPSASIVYRQRLGAIEEFSAVSYVWGEKKSTLNLEMTEGNDISYLRITATVDTLLRYLCKKAHRVPNMDRIFGGADEVRIWLGLEDPMTTTIYSFFREATREETIEGGGGDLLPKYLKFDYYGNCMKPACGAGLLLAIKFFDQPWFALVVSAAKLLMCVGMSHYGVRMAASLHAPRENRSILDSLLRYHNSQCSEKKDRIVALTGLNPTERFVLDYSNDWRGICYKIDSFYLQSRRNDAGIQILLYLFDLGSIEREKAPNCPLWVPDWSKMRSQALPLLQGPKNVVNLMEKRLSSLDVSDKALLSLCVGNMLRIHPLRLPNKHPAWQVAYTMLATGQGCAYAQIIEILEDLSPSSAARPSREVMGLSYLVQAIVDFHDWKEKNQSAPLVAYFQERAGRRPGKICPIYSAPCNI
ncbi:hypothetical protein PspLS_11976 [Pyricularia sp. CBS 133598]|nr:hypothetical protein PspLS_11976 [Pyricularia sp. CBS 133598]